MRRRRRKRRIKGILDLGETRQNGDLKYGHLTLNHFSNDARRLAWVVRRVDGLEIGESVVVLGRSGAKIEVFRDFDGLVKRIQIARCYHLSDELEISLHMRKISDTPAVARALDAMAESLRQKKKRSDAWHKSRKKKPKKRDKGIEIVWQF